MVVIGRDASIVRLLVGGRIGVVTFNNGFVMARVVSLVVIC